MDTALKPGQFNNTALGQSQYDKTIGHTKLASTNPKKNVTNNSSNSLPQYDSKGGFTSGGVYYAPDSIQAKNSRAFSQSTTTLSSDKQADITKNNNDLTVLTDKGVSTDPKTGVAKYADGTVYAEPAKPVTSDTSTEDKQIEDAFAEMKKNTDAIAAGSIASIQSQYARLKEQQRKVNESQLAGTRSSLLMSGAMQSDVYSDDAIAYRVNQGINEIKDLENQEDELINTAKAAQLAGNNKILEAKVAQINKIREEKVAATAKLNEEIVKSTQAKQKLNDQIKTEEAISTLYEQGVTDPVQISKQLRAAGYPATTKEVSDNVALLSGIGGTGIVGEYNFYKADQRARGLPTVGFDEYQTLDTNRKRSIAAAANVAGSDLNTIEAAVFNKIVDKYNASPAIKALDKANMLKNIANEVLADPSNATSQLALIYSYIKGLDTDSAVKEGEIDLVRSIQSYLNTFQTSLERVTSGKPVSTDAATKIANGSLKLIESIENTAKRKEADFKAQAKVNGTKVLGAWDDYRTSAQEYKDELSNNEKNDPLNLGGGTSNTNNPLGI